MVTQGVLSARAARLTPSRGGWGSRRPSRPRRSSGLQPRIEGRRRLDGGGVARAGHRLQAQLSPPSHPGDHNLRQRHTGAIVGSAGTAGVAGIVARRQVGDRSQRVRWRAAAARWRPACRGKRVRTGRAGPSWHHGRIFGLCRGMRKMKSLTASSVECPTGRSSPAPASAGPGGPARK